MATLYLSLGTNLGNRQKNIETALALIDQRVGTVMAQSSIIETEPWGFESSNRFLNMAVKVLTELKPIEVLETTQAIEREMGRTSKSDAGGYKDRIIDIDILLYDDLVIDTPRLTIPHPHMYERRFVMEPLTEIAPHLNNNR